MKKTLSLSFIFVLFLLSGSLQAQSFEVPEGYAFTTKDDYGTYEKQVIGAVNWLEQTPLNQEAAKRKEVNTFLLKYLTGSPVVTVELQAFVMELTKKNPDLLMAFMAGWAKYKLENPAATDKVKLNTEGVKTMLKIYSLGGACKDKNIEKLAKLASGGELEAWVKSKVS